MRKALAALVVSFLVLVGCATTVSGKATIEAGAKTTQSTISSTIRSSSVSSSSRESSSSTSSSSSSRTSTSSSTTSTISTTTSTTVAIPDGFDPVTDTDFAYRPMTLGEFECTADQAAGCFGIKVFSPTDCAAGATVVLEINNEDEDPAVVIGEATGTTPPIAAGQTQQAIIGDSTGFEGTASASIKKITC